MDHCTLKLFLHKPQLASMKSSWSHLRLNVQVRKERNHTKPLSEKLYSVLTQTTRNHTCHQQSIPNSRFLASGTMDPLLSDLWSLPSAKRRIVCITVLLYAWFHSRQAYITYHNRWLQCLMMVRKTPPHVASPARTFSIYTGETKVERTL